MGYFINKIRINELCGLHNCNIRIEDEKIPNLIITSKNGSGKTMLLRKMAEMLEDYLKEENYDLLT